MISTLQIFTITENTKIKWPTGRKETKPNGQQEEKKQNQTHKRNYNPHS
jgi:hypothetical protein